jgi:outer membrane protein TolC
VSKSKEFVKYIFILLIGFTSIHLNSQTLQLSLDTCLTLAIKNYPAIHQLDLITQSEKYTLSNITKAWWPQFNLNAQASYQSDVTHLDINIPNLPIPEGPDKDQYKFNLDVAQMIYDGGQISAQKNIAKTNSKLEILKTETELYKVKERILQLYFGNLLIQQQLASIDLLINDIEAQIQKSQAALEAKIIAANSLYILQAEKIKANQKREELDFTRSQWLLMLSHFIKLKLGIKTVFLLPVEPMLNLTLNRPELAIIDQQISLLNDQNNLSTSMSRPRVAAFGQFGYANPALNFLESGFQSYYIAGVRFSWNLSSFYTTRNTNRLFISNKNIASLQKESIVFQTQLQLIRQMEEIRMYRSLSIDDKKLIELRKKITEAAKVQLDNGIISASDFIRELNAEEQARTNEMLHKIQYLQSTYLYNYYSGY